MTKTLLALTRLLAAVIIFAAALAFENPQPLRADGGGCERQAGSRCITATQDASGYRCATEDECTTCRRRTNSICFHGGGPMHRGWRDVDAS